MDSRRPGKSGLRGAGVDDQAGDRIGPQRPETQHVLHLVEHDVIELSAAEEQDHVGLVELHRADDGEIARLPDVTWAGRGDDSSDAVNRSDTRVDHQARNLLGDRRYTDDAAGAREILIRERHRCEMADDLGIQAVYAASEGSQVLRVERSAEESNV